MSWGGDLAENLFKIKGSPLLNVHSRPSKVTFWVRSRCLSLNVDQKIIITLRSFLLFFERKRMHYPMRFFAQDRPFFFGGLLWPRKVPSRTYPDGHKCHVSLSLFYVAHELTHLLSVANKNRYQLLTSSSIRLLGNSKGHNGWKVAKLYFICKTLILK